MANFYLKEHDTKIDIGRKDITINVMKIVCSLFSILLRLLHDSFVALAAVHNTSFSGSQFFNSAAGN